MKLLEAGLICFGSLGYSGSTIKAICKQAELTERYFYESFANKEALLHAVYTGLMDTLAAELHETALANRSDPALAITRIIRRYFEILRDQEYRAQVQLFEVLGISRDLDRLYQRKMREMASSVQDVLEMFYPQLKQAQLSPVYYSAIIGAHWQVANEWVLSGYSEDIDQLVVPLREMIVALIKPHL